MPESTVSFAGRTGLVIMARGGTARRPDGTPQRMLAHMMKPDLSGRTVCGRFTFDDMVPGQITEDPRPCGACQCAAAAKAAGVTMGQPPRGYRGRV